MKTFNPCLVTSMHISITKLFCYENVKKILEANHSDTSIVSKKLKSTAFLEIIQGHPFVFFVKQNTLTANISVNDPLPYISNIHYAENLYLLAFMYKNFNSMDLENVQINCIFIATSNDFRKIEVLNNVCFLENFLERNKESQINKSGKLNYAKLENMFFSIFSKNEYKKLLTKPGKYFFQSIFKLNVHRKRDIK
ncbi:MAG: hypothetical protein AB7D43_08095 [Sulfurimonadaceae bacterium]